MFHKMLGLLSPATDRDSWVQSSDSSLNSGAQPVAEFPEDSIIGIRNECSRFRILVIGRANAGKTTLLKRVCNSVEEPKIYDEDGKKIEAKILKESMNRGEHNIENQMIFKSNPGFIFHDSCGFESGALEETEKVKNFIKTRAASSSLAKQLHAIWYCLPMADTTRPFLKTDEEFFDLEGVGNVPVIAIFTKCDGLFTEVRGAHLAGGMDPNELNTKCINKVEEILTARFEALRQRRFAPAAHVNTQDMGEPRHTGTAQKKAFAAMQDKCVKKLVQVTASALTNEALRLLFVSVQRNNLDLCAFYAIEIVVQGCLAFFPHVSYHHHLYLHPQALLDFRTLPLRTTWCCYMHVCTTDLLRWFGKETEIHLCI
ncbi:hypothetical protein B0H13DRAFT_1718538 [Mycena leptocephala]|nr:hypothetical protein B0H13DRAFT_1718538 [Mycena leptocephala]